MTGVQTCALPISDRLLQTLKLTSEVLEQFTKRCVLTLKANKKRCKELLERSTAYATLLTPKFGYDVISEAVRESVKSGKTLREVIVEKKIMTNKEFDSFVKN